MFDNLVLAVKYYLHQLYLEGKPDGCRADLRGADLRGADLRGADLRWADLCEAYLYGADLRGADLRGADLRGADLRGADLREAYLCGAYLRGADLRGADLRGADLRGADLREAVSISIVAFDNRGYTLVCSKFNGEFWFNAGCRSFCMDDALAHWGSDEYPNRERGDKYVRAVKFLVETWSW